MKPSNYSVILHSGVSKILGKTLLAFVQHEQKTVKKRLISDYLATIQQLFHAKMLATIYNYWAKMATTIGGEITNGRNLAVCSRI